MSPGWSLRLKVTAFVALLVISVIGLGTFIETRVFEQGAERELRDTAQLTARAVGDDLGHDTPLEGPELASVLQDYVVAATEVQSISVVELTGGTAFLRASTAAGTGRDLLDFATSVAAQDTPRWDASTPSVRQFGEPVTSRGHRFVVVLTVSSATVDAIRDSGRRLAFIFAVSAIVVLSLLSTLLADRLILRPIGSITRVMQRASAGDLTVRAPVKRHDELGVIASGLNDMLDRLESSSESLQQRVREATGELRQRNAELVTSSQRVLTLRKALAMAEQRAAIGKMAASVAHQIGTPLNLVSGYIQMIRTQDRIDPRARARLSSAAAQVERVAGAIRGLLDSTRRPLTAVERVDAVALVRNMCQAAAPMLQAASVEVRLAGEREPVLVDVSAEQIELALLSLISNSIDAMPDGGRIEIDVRRDGDRVLVAVKDSGQGFPDDLLPRVFEPWVTTKAVGLGTGLGLSIVKDITAAHGGNATARNAESGGAVVTIDLPAAAREVEPAEPAGSRR